MSYGDGLGSGPASRETNVLRQNQKEIAISEAEVIKKRYRERMRIEKEQNREKHINCARQRKIESRDRACTKVLHYVATKFRMNIYDAREDRKKYLGLQLLARRWCWRSLGWFGFFNGAALLSIAWLFYLGYVGSFILLGVISFVIDCFICAGSADQPSMVEKIAFLRYGEQGEQED